MPARLELHGRQFARLRVLGRSHKDKGQAWLWNCECECGVRVVVRGATLVAGRTSACASCSTAAANTTHGMSRTTLYRRWRAMHARISSPRHKGYHNYGGRGIMVCLRWQRFENFLADMGPSFSPELELDRINVNGDYEPGNCRWATRSQQQRNRRTNHMVTWRSHTLTVQEWAEMLGLCPNTIVHRLKRGWSVERTLSKDASLDLLLELANEEEEL